MSQYFDRADEIKHLSEEQIEQLYQRYLDGEKTARLFIEFNIPATVRSLLKILPPIVSKDLTCPYCELPMWVRRHAKGTPMSIRSHFKCVRCEHHHFDPGYYGRQKLCTCIECHKLRHQAITEQARRERLVLEERYAMPGDAVPYASLGFSQKLVLLALLDDGSVNGAERIASLNAECRSERLAVSDEASEELVKDLHECGVLQVDLDSDIKAFDRETDCVIKDFYAVHWLANVALQSGARSTRDALYRALYEELSGGIQPAWKSELYTLMFGLAREESIQYIQILANEVNFVFGAQQRAKTVIGQLLQDFSVSHIYYFARLAVKNAAHFYATGKSRGRSHAANTIPGSMLGTAQDALARNWRKTAYRDARLPQSTMHRLLYDVVLSDSGAGFTKSPGVYWRDVLVPQFFSANTAGEDPDGNLQLFCRECDSSNIDVSMNKLMVQTMCYDCATVSKFHAIEDLID